VIDSSSTDEALLASMAMGDQAAAVVFVRRYQRRVFGLAYSMTNDASVAEEVAQEALIRVWRHAPVFDHRRGSVTSWVLTITRNLTIDALRMRRAVPTDPDDFAASAMISLEHNPEDAIGRGNISDVVLCWRRSMGARPSRSVRRRPSRSGRPRRAYGPVSSGSVLPSSIYDKLRKNDD
jgi:RNA polymerase sigma factor (sigma-70 family)